MVGLDRISAAQRRMRKAEPSLCCSISPLDKDGLGLLSAKQAKLDGTSGSGCPCAERGSDGSRDGAEQGHLRVLDLSLLWGFCGIPEDEVQFLTWLQVTVNMLQLLLLTALDFCIVQAFFYAFWFLHVQNRVHTASLRPGAAGGIVSNNTPRKGFKSTRREAKEDKMFHLVLSPPSQKSVTWQPQKYPQRVKRAFDPRYSSAVA